MRVTRALLLMAAAGFLLACGQNDAVAPGDEAGPIGAQLAAAPIDQVALCHFPGHVGDWVLAREGHRCVTDGGHILVVPRQACEIAHRAITNPWSGDPYNCAEADNIPAWWPGPAPWDG